MKRILVAVLLLVGLATIATSANAAEFRVPTSGAEIVEIGEKEAPKNLYTAGEAVTVNAAVVGDLVVAGGKVMVTGDVADGLLAAGGTVIIRGNVGHNARVAGGDVTFSGIVSGDLLVAGGTVIITDQAVINGDLLIGSGDVTIDGLVKGTVRIGSGTATINNSVGRVYAQVGSLTLGSKAVVNGDLIYTADKPVTLSDGASVTGTTTFTKTKTQNPVTGFITVSSLLMMLGLIILLLALIRFWPQFSQTVWNRSLTGMAPMIGYGALGVFILPMLMIGLAITVVGLPMAGILFFTWITLMILAMIYSKLLIGVWIVQKLTKSVEAKLDWQAVVVGVLVSGGLMFVPIVGWLINFIIFLLAFGVLLSGLFKRETANIKTV